ncbi:fatty acyl-AMP ligase [Mycobacterium szulgai]|uniref:Long-chain fatty acid--CoA ligase n=1 Tax=Mycobacterium szulgai TaxID=1787 RepID=A0A1X2DIS5_MYCSZ|nr:fatty acyl-AMP ligase [Mycobacterium szulgai]ORW88095.1 long-chain fatty acid--CoA ligase [Mycobacterium szulgai]
MSSLIREIVAVAAATPHGLNFGPVAEPKRMTWSEVHRTAAGMSNALAASGIGRGDAVAVLAGDASDVAPLAQALWIRGTALTMLQHPTPRIDLAVWVSDTVRAVRMLGASVVVVGEPFGMAITALTEAGLTVCTVDSLRGDGPLALEPTDDGDIAMRQLTSGSTGIPKAVEISHGNLAANIESTRLAVDLVAGRSVTVSWLPLCHDMGMVGFVCVPMRLGLEAVVIRTDEFLRRPIVWAEMISKFRATVTGGPNFGYSVLARVLERADPRAIDLSSLRVAINGAEPIDHRDLEHFATVGARFGMRPGVPTPFYGLAEATLTVTAGSFLAPAVVDRVSRRRLTVAHRAEPAISQAQDVQHIVCVGLPVSGTEVRITKDRNVLGHREIGTIELRGPSVAGSYRTVAGVVALAGQDGWFDTGDLGYLDEQGRLYICGRSKDLIVLAGRNLYPHDIERAAAGVEGVRKGCVVALRVDADREGFAVLAEVYDRYDEQARTQLRRDIAARVSTHVGHAPREVRLLAPGSLPKTTSGKLRRSSARALLQ